MIFDTASSHSHYTPDRSLYGTSASSVSTSACADFPVPRLIRNTAKRVSNPSDDQRWNGLDRVTYCQIRRSPNNVNGEKGQQQFHPRRGRNRNPCRASKLTCFWVTES